MATIYNRTTIPAKNPALATKSQMYRGFSTVSRDSENFVLYDFELIKQDILNNFNVRQGERLMNPSFGTVIWDLLFEPLTDQLKDLISNNVSDILNSDPRVQASNVTIIPYDTGLQIQCVLTYLPYNIQQNLQLKFDQENGMLAA